jgi:hypothetical protein
MSKDMMPKRWSVGNYDGYMVERDGGDYVEAEDVEPLVAEIARLRARVEVLEGALREIADHHPESKMTRALVRFVGLEAKP